MLTYNDIKTVADTFGYNIETVACTDRINRVVTKGRQFLLYFYANGNGPIFPGGLEFTKAAPTLFKQSICVAAVIRSNGVLQTELQNLLDDSALQVKYASRNNYYSICTTTNSQLVISDNGIVTCTEHCAQTKPYIVSIVNKLLRKEKPKSLSLQHQLQRAGYTVKNVDTFKTEQVYNVFFDKGYALAATYEVEQGRLVDFTVHNNRREIRQVLEKHNNTKQRFVITEDNNYAFELEHYMSNDSYTNIDQGTLANNDKLTFISMVASYVAAVERRKGSLATTIEYKGNAYSIVPHAIHGQVKTFLEELLCGC